MNREIFSNNGLYPLIGDVQSTPGSNKAVVVGIEGIPIDTSVYPLSNGAQLTLVNSEWLPIVAASIYVEGIPVSDDYEISVNVAKPALVNGV